MRGYGRKADTGRVEAGREGRGVRLGVLLLSHRYCLVRMGLVTCCAGPHGRPARVMGDLLSAVAKGAAHNVVVCDRW